ncbi:Long-chain-fatty-acid--CoA ligase [Nocardioides dokdonensis FR1436]|uniref:Long-chain-fatty-acid--CoA ligase n=1 Tax=Nocardioides dokdonensis FR1436 TaxID=1300347 RepID=A0A1A9GPA0_9ACTN|nr:AMP-binding protein [Nocardioides dokdonensis]ANH40118.1 Long-chain-fatty-acid--CoA ligase [Nocardioides dokdonensis FR1436]
MIAKLLTGAGTAGTSLRVLAQAGVLRPYPPTTLLRLARILRDWGTGPAGGFMSMAARSPAAVGVVDELGDLTWRELHRRSNALARALREQGVGEGDAVAVMCRNHRFFLDATCAGAKLGADVLYLNTAFAGPQLVEVLERDRPAVVVHDQEFGPLLADTADVPRIVAWVDDDRDLPVGTRTLEQLVAGHDDADLDPPGRHGRTVILTSGTTGTPKGAPRSEAGIDAAVALLSAIPLRHGWRTHVAAPLFHTWGFAHMALAMLLGSTLVLRRRFDPEDTLRTIADEGCQSVVVIPVMLQRILALPVDVLEAHDLSHVEVVASSGSALPGDLALTWMDRFGDHLYSTYGSTEVAYAAVAGPADLREAPSTAGRAPYATVLKVLDEAGDEVAAGRSGRIFVGNGMLFEGYTGGGSKEVVDGLMCTGDVGRLGEDGRLYVEGRDDDMIVSGGENVFPQEVEDCIARHDDVVEVAAVGVDDDDFGKRLRAFVVVRAGAELDQDGVQTWVKQQLARYKVPRDVVFLDELPRNATGKVLKRELTSADRHDQKQDEDA